MNKDINEIFLSFFSPRDSLETPKSTKRHNLSSEFEFSDKEGTIWQWNCLLLWTVLELHNPNMALNELVCHYLLGSINWNMWTSRMRKVRLFIIYFGKSKIWLHVIDKVPFNQVTMKIKTKMMIKWDSAFAFNDTFEAT